MAHLLGAEGLSITYGTRTVLDNVTLGVDAGDRIGFVGRNGDGKSTLMRLLAGRAEPDSGRVTWRGGVSVGFLDQQDILDHQLSLREAVVGGAADHEWASQPWMRDVAQGLLGGLDWEQPVGELSGGQRRRVALARLLMGQHEVIMLDEPRNSMGCTFRTPRFYRRGGQTSCSGARHRARVGRACAPGLATPIGKVGC